MHRLALGIEAAGRGGARRVLGPHALAVAAAVAELLQAEADPDLKCRVGCLLLDELADVAAFPDRTVESLLQKVAIASVELSQCVATKLLSFECPDDLQDFLEELEGLVKPQMVLPEEEPDNPFPFLHRDSVLGRFLRRVLLAAEEASFETICRLLAECSSLSLALTRVAAGDLSPAAHVPARPALTDAQAAEHAHLLVQRLQQSGAAPAPATLRLLAKRFPHLPAVQYLQYQAAMAAGDYEAAVDHIHRYFDSVVAPAHGPPPAPRGGGAPAGIASYALLSLAACERSFCHTANAELCVQEAVRLAHHNGEDHVLLAVALHGGGARPPLGAAPPSSALELAQPLFCRQTLDYARRLLSDHGAEAPGPWPALGEPSDPDVAAPETDVPIPRRVWSALQRATAAAHSPPAALGPAWLPDPPPAVTTDLHSGALLASGEAWAALSRHGLAEATLQGIDPATAHPDRLQDALCARARWRYTVLGDYEGALDLLLMIPVPEQHEESLGATLSPAVAHTAYYLGAVHAVHSGDLPRAQRLVARLAGLARRPPGGEAAGPGPDAGLGLPEAVRSLDVLQCRILLALAHEDFAAAGALVREGLATARAHRLAEQEARFLHLQAQGALRQPGPCHTQAVQAVLRSLALAKTLHHTTLLLPGLLLLAEALLRNGDPASAKAILADFKRHHLQNSTQEQLAQYHLLSAQCHLCHSAAPPGDTMPIDLFAAQPPDTEAEGEAALEDLQRSERLFAGLCHLEGLCCVRRARAEALAALGRSLQRNHAARAFVELHMLLLHQKLAGPADGLVGGVEAAAGPLHWVATEKQRLATISTFSTPALHRAQVGV